MSRHEHLKAPNRYAYHTARLLARAAHVVLPGTITTSGELNILERSEAYVQAAPHRSMLDITAMGIAAYRVAGHQMRFMGKDSLEPKKLLGRAGARFVDRQRGLSVRDYEEIKEEANQSAVFGWYWGGTRSQGREIGDDELKAMICTPPVFENGLTVVPVGLAGTDAPDLGFIHIHYGSPIFTEKVDFQPQPEWDARRRLGMLKRAIGAEAIDGFMEQLLDGMRASQAIAYERHDQRTESRMYELAALTG